MIQIALQISTKISRKSGGKGCGVAVEWFFSGSLEGKSVVLLQNIVTQKVVFKREVLALESFSCRPGGGGDFERVSVACWVSHVFAKCRFLRKLAELIFWLEKDCPSIERSLATLTFYPSFHPVFISLPSAVLPPSPLPPRPPSILRYSHPLFHIFSTDLPRTTSADCVLV